MASIGSSPAAGAIAQGAVQDVDLLPSEIEDGRRVQAVDEQRPPRTEGAARCRPHRGRCTPQRRSPVPCPSTDRGTIRGMVERDHWFEDLADHLGSAYLRYSFTKGTEQEVDFLVDALGLGPGMRVLDVGCGPGRHAHALGRRGIAVHGVDISRAVRRDGAAASAPPGVTFERLDARAAAVRRRVRCRHLALPGRVRPGRRAGRRSVDRTADPDRAVLEGIARALRPGGRLAVSAFCAYFQVRWLDEGMTFDADRGVNHERTELRSETGETRDPRPLDHVLHAPRAAPAGRPRRASTVEHVWSVRPGEYGAPTAGPRPRGVAAAWRTGRPTVEQPEPPVVP